MKKACGSLSVRTQLEEADASLDTHKIPVDLYDINRTEYKWDPIDGKDDLLAFEGFPATNGLIFFSVLLHHEKGYVTWKTMVLHTSDLQYQIEERQRLRRQSSRYFSDPFSSPVEDRKESPRQKKAKKISIETNTKSAILDIFYRGIKYHDPVSGIDTGILFIESVVLNITRPQDIILSLKADVHRIELLIQVVSRDVSDTKVQYHFLWRAQKITTMADSGTRSYNWLSKASAEKSAFPGLLIRDDSNQHLEQARDLMRIRNQTSNTEFQANASAKQIAKLPKFSDPPDNDEYVNEARYLPLELTQEDTVIFKIYNLKHTPIRCAETSIRYGEFETRHKEKKRFLKKKKKVLGQRILRRDLTPQIDLFIYYEFEKKLLITAVRLVANDYNTSLDLQYERGPQSI